MNLLTLRWKGLAGMGNPSTSTFKRCSPTARGTNSAWNVPELPTAETAAGTEAPFGPMPNYVSAHRFTLAPSYF